MVLSLLELDGSGSTRAGFHYHSFSSPAESLQTDNHSRDDWMPSIKGLSACKIPLVGLIKLDSISNERVGLPQVPGDHGWWYSSLFLSLSNHPSLHTHPSLFQQSGLVSVQVLAYRRVLKNKPSMALKEAYLAASAGHVRAVRSCYELSNCLWCWRQEYIRWRAIF